MRKFVLSALAFLLVLANRLPAQEPPATDEPARVSALIEKLRSPELGVRFQAVKELRKLEAQGKAALTALAKVAESDPDEDVRKAATETLKVLMGKATAPGPLRTGTPL